MIKHILVDMDGVLFNFCKGAFQAHGREFKEEEYPKQEWYIEKVLGLSVDEFWDKINDIGPKFWSDLEPYGWNKDIFAMIDNIGAKWSILSTPSRHPNSVQGKVQCLQNYFGPKIRNYFFGEHKYLFAKPGFVLIDDNDKNCLEFSSHGGNALLFAQPWNSRHAVTDRIDLLSRELEALTDEA